MKLKKKKITTKLWLKKNDKIRVYNVLLHTDTYTHIVVIISNIPITDNATSIAIRKGLKLNKAEMFFPMLA